MWDSLAHCRWPHSLVADPGVWKWRERGDHRRHACMYSLSAFDCGCDWLLEVPALTIPWTPPWMYKSNKPFLSYAAFVRIFYQRSRNETRTQTF